MLIVQSGEANTLNLFSIPNILDEPSPSEQSSTLSPLPSDAGSSSLESSSPDEYSCKEQGASPEATEPLACTHRMLEISPWCAQNSEIHLNKHCLNFKKTTKVLIDLKTNVKWKSYSSIETFTNHEAYSWVFNTRMTTDIHYFHLYMLKSYGISETKANTPLDYAQVHT